MAYLISADSTGLKSSRMRERQQDIKRGKEMVGIMINISKLVAYLISADSKQV